MEDVAAKKLVTTSKLVPTIHSKFPIPKSSTIDQSIENVERCIIYPEPSDLNSNSAIVFMIHESPGHYIDVGSLELEIKISLLLVDGAARPQLVNDNRAYYINNLLSTLFPIRKVSIAGVNVETQYHGSYLGNIRFLLESNNAALNKIGRPRGLFKVKTDMVRSPINDGVCDTTWFE